MTNIQMIITSYNCILAGFAILAYALCKSAGSRHYEKAIAEEKLKRGGRDLLI